MERYNINNVEKKWQNLWLEKKINSSIKNNMNVVKRRKH